MKLESTAALLATLMATGAAQAPDSGQLPVKPLPVPTGVVPLPQGPPPTGMQAPVPAPAHAMPNADSPLAWSPDVAAIEGFAQSRPLRIEDAVAVALYTNRNFAMSVASLQQASARTGETRSELNPTVGLHGSLSYFDKATTAQFSPTSPPIVLNPQYNPVYSAAINLPIDITGVIHAAVSQSEFNEIAARIDVNRVRNQIVYDVKTAFYNVLRAQAQLSVATENVNNALERLTFGDKNYSAGTSARFDVLTAQRDVADAQQALVTAHAAVSVNLAALKNTMGTSIRARIRISAEGAIEAPADAMPPAVALVPPKPADSAPTKATGATFTPLPLPSPDQVDDNFDFGPEFDGLLKEAMSLRPEVLEAQAQVSAAKKGIQYARRSLLPSVSIGLSHVYTPNATAFTRVDQSVATLDVSIPLFDGGLGREREREARAQAALAEINRRQAADQVQVDVQQAYIALVQARQRVAVTAVEVAQAREALRVGRVRYQSGVSQQVGVSPQIELSNSQLSLTQAETNQVNALYDYNNARAQLDRALGRYAFTGREPGYKTAPR